jgi:hypothetical protein
MCRSGERVRGIGCGALFFRSATPEVFDVVFHREQPASPPAFQQASRID